MPHFLYETKRYDENDEKDFEFKIQKKSLLEI